MEQNKIALVLLAAGNSVRFGGNKLLSIYGGKRMYRHIVDQVRQLPPGIFVQKIAVSQYRQILDDLSGEGYTLVENTAPELGISHSIHLALDAVCQADAVCFAVCDQPDLKAETIRRFVDAWRESGRSIGCLSHGGISGNPVIFEVRYIPELRKLTGDTGGKRVLKAHPEEVYYHEIPDDSELVDIDTPIKI